MKHRFWPALALLALCVAPAAAHFTMLLPQAASAKVNDTVTFTCQWGHPFEHQLFDAPAPESVFVIGPDGKKTDLTKTLTPAKAPAGDKKEATVHRFSFKPDQHGDYVFVLNTPPMWMAEDEEFLQDSVKVVFHVQAQKGWDRAAGLPLELVPLTRPYGLQAGTVFQAQALFEGKPLAGALVEVERYNTAPPKELPPDEQRTLSVKTDPNGVVTCTLNEPGWWCVTAQREAGKKEHDGKAYPVWQRATLWVCVDAKK